MPADPKPLPRAAAGQDYARALTPVELALSLLAGAGGFALAQLCSLVGGGG